MLNIALVSDYLACAQNTRILLRQALCPSGYCLIIEDNPNVARYLKNVFEYRNMKSKVVSSVISAKYELKTNNKNIVCAIIDLQYDSKGCMEIIKYFEENMRKIPYILYTDREDEIDLLNQRYPHIKIIVKSKDTIEDLFKALGI